MKRVKTSLSGMPFSLLPGIQNAIADAHIHTHPLTHNSHLLIKYVCSYFINWAFFSSASNRAERTHVSPVSSRRMLSAIKNEEPSGKVNFIHRDYITKHTHTHTVCPVRVFASVEFSWKTCWIWILPLPCAVGPEQAGWIWKENIDFYFTSIVPLKDGMNYFSCSLGIALVLTRYYSERNGIRSAWLKIKIHTEYISLNKISKLRSFSSEMLFRISIFGIFSTKTSQFMIFFHFLK